MLYDESITVTPPTTVPRGNQGASSATSRSKYTGFGNNAAESSKREYIVLSSFALYGSYEEMKSC